MSDQKPTAVPLPPPGPDRDALCMVALGYERTSDPHAWVTGPPDVRGWRSCHIGLPEFSTRNNDALLFFERMVESTGIGSISADMEDARGEGFVVTASFMCSTCGGTVSYSAPFPDAITAAGLLAVGLCHTDGIGCGDCAQGEAERST